MPDTPQLIRPDTYIWQIECGSPNSVAPRTSLPAECRSHRERSTKADPAVFSWPLILGQPLVEYHTGTRDFQPCDDFCSEVMPRSMHVQYLGSGKRP